MEGNVNNRAMVALINDMHTSCILLLLVVPRYILKVTISMLIFQIFGEVYFALHS